MEPLLYFVLLMVVVFWLLRRKPRNRPMTARQAEYIQALLTERASDQFRFREPRTIEEASWLISRLQKLPYRDDDDE